MRSLILVTLTMLSGCASVAPYATLSLGVQLDGMSDYWVQTDRNWQCSKNVQFSGEFGLEFENNWTVGYHHQSWVLCGQPLGNERPEIYQDDIRITKKFGGYK